jgi:hypothetical protein
MKPANGFVGRSGYADEFLPGNRHVTIRRLLRGFQKQARHSKGRFIALRESDRRFIRRPFVKSIGG